MRIQPIDGQNYRLPNELNDFQLKMYVHLIKWKWKYITTEPGHDRGFEYDAILPDVYGDKYPMLFPDIVPEVGKHLQKFPFRIHTYFNHMASSQAANINLFLPVLLHPNVNGILGDINPEFKRLAIEYLDRGWRIEFWDEPFGVLADKSKAAGTDADIGIAYYNRFEKLCLWLIEHKLTEHEFTTCGGFKSKGRKERHDCMCSFDEILKNKNICYYHDVCKYNYWKITEINRDFFVNHANYSQCPFQGGLNQLWRNQLLAMAVEQEDRQPFKYASFSVVKHPGNKELDQSLGEYRKLINNNPKFSVFTSADVLRAAERHRNEKLGRWANWYRKLYNL
jgi:hypothetical protein